MTQEFMGLMAARRVDEPAILKRASLHFARSLELRPVSPNTWANLAEAKYLEGDAGQMFERAVFNAARLGPSEPHVQRMVVHYGLPVWDEVASDARDAIGRMLAAWMRRNPLEMLQIAQRRGRLSVACRHLVGVPRQPDPKWSQLCESREAIR